MWFFPSGNTMIIVFFNRIHFIDKIEIVTEEITRKEKYLSVPILFIQ